MKPFFLFFTAILIFASGCDSLRFAPTQSQKQIALKTHLNAVAVDSSGADPATPATKQLIDGTASSLAYTGMPANPDIADYQQTLSQANADAARRPVIDDVFEQVDTGLGLAAELAILFGAGGVGLGGKKLIDWITSARQKSKSLREIIDANELFKQKLNAGAKFTAEEVIALFKSSQKQKQSGKTPVIVTENKTS